MSAKEDKLIKEIVIERIKSMSPNVKIALGSKGGFLNRNDLLEEVTKNTLIGKKIVEIQLRYLRALKEGIVKKNISKLKTDPFPDAGDYLPYLFNNYLVLEVCGNESAVL